MPIYDPDEKYTHTAEPKLLSIDFASSCFPTFFASPPTPPISPPCYDSLIMASNTTQYHRISESMRASMDSEASNMDFDRGLLLLDPTGSDDGSPDEKKQHKITFHPTLWLRILTICLFITAFVLFIVDAHGRSIPAAIFTCIGFVRNIIVVIHYVCSKQLRVRFSVEFRKHSAKTGKPRQCPGWLKQGAVHVLFDGVIFVVVLITTITATVAARGWSYYWYSTDELIAGCVCSYVGNVIYLISLVDLGKPSNITSSFGIAFNYEKNKKPEQPPPTDPMMGYRDVEAAGGLGVNDMSRKTGADSPIIV